MWLGPLLVSLSLAQDVAPEARPLGAQSISRGSVWTEDRSTQRFEAGPWSLSRNEGGTAWLLGLEDGRVLRSVDGARTWRQVLRSPTDREDLDEEQLILEAEQLRDEAIEPSATEDAQEPEESDEEGAEEVLVETPDAAEDGADFEDIDALTEMTLHGEQGEGRAAEVWFVPGQDDLAFTARGDGLWRSEDAGNRWTRVDDATDVLVFALDAGADVVLAGTRTGVRLSFDHGVSWLDAEGATDGARVDALVVLNALSFAGTPSGLFRSADGLRWSQVGLTEPVHALLTDASGSLWAATPSGVRRSDDGGDTFLPPGQQVILGLRGLASLGGPGHLAAWGSEGLWESLDGGVRWQPLYDGLRDPDVRDLVMVNKLPLLAGSAALWRLGYRLTDAGSTASSAPAERLSQDQLGLLVSVATRRKGLDLASVSPKRVAIRPLLPTLTVQVGYLYRQARYSFPLLGETLENTYAHPSLAVRACFGGCSVFRGSDADGDAGELYSDVSADDLQDLGDDALGDLYVIDGEILSSEGGEPVAAANLAQKVRKYRTQVADQVVGAWLRLETLNDSPVPTSLAARVARTLDVQEAEARLDLYTDGAYTRSRTSELKP